MLSMLTFYVTHLEWNLTHFASDVMACNASLVLSCELLTSLAHNILTKQHALPGMEVLSHTEVVTRLVSCLGETDEAHELQILIGMAIVEVRRHLRAAVERQPAQARARVGEEAQR